MPTYKLHYFNIRGRAEVARLIMAHANVEYEDYRFEFNDFATIKASKKHLGYLERLSWFSKEKECSSPDYPLGQVPVLEVDGKMLAQSRAINRFLAKKYGLAGKDAMEQAKVDMYVDCLEDLIPKIRPAVREYMTNQRNQQDTELVLIHEVAEKHLVPYIQLIEKHLEKNGSGFLVGNSVRKRCNCLSLVFFELSVFLDSIGFYRNSTEKLFEEDEIIWNLVFFFS